MVGAGAGALLVDIRGRKLRRLDHGSGRVESFDLPELAGSLALREGDGVLVAMQNGVMLFDPERGTIEPFARPQVVARTLFVTTASQNLTADELEAQPLAGGLLAIDVGIRGLPEPLYRGRAFLASGGSASLRK
jgi:sugar lactone lactonase YvrE